MKKKDAGGDAAAGSPHSKRPQEASASDISQFIPYYCHFNPHTLLTKNGELMQILKIATNLDGLEYEGGHDSPAIVREAIRQAVTQHVDVDKVAIWFHTLRKRKPIRYHGKFKEDFATKTHEAWRRLHHWKHQYYNEIYISVLYDGQPAPLLDAKQLRNVALPGRNRIFRNAYLEAAYEELERVVAAMTEHIAERFRVQRLAAVERIPPPSELPLNQAVFYSEPMEFLGQLINLRHMPMLLPELDLSQALPATVHTFGFNAVETRDMEGKRRFSGMLTLKQYREVPLETLDRLVQAPMEFIVSQSFHFIPATGALKQYKQQKQIFDISGDAYCIQASGIEDMMSSHSSSPTDFGEHQTSVMVLTDEFKHLDEQITKVQAAFADLGLITIREDVKLEECFWAQLPGNFEFIRRRDTINTRRVGGFCRLNRYPQGAASGNHWGDAVTLMPTLVGSPYFFNFHHQDNGHTVLFDFNSFDDPVCPIAMNFLLTEARKYDNRLYVFDRDRSANLLFQKLGGNYHSFPALSHNPEEPKFHINPFLLEDNPRNRSFLLAWCGTLIAPERGLLEAQKEKLKAAINQLYASPADRRNLAGLADTLAPADASLASALAKWHGKGAYSGIFDSAEDTFHPLQALHAFDMSPVVKHKECVVPVLSYLLHRIVSSVDGRPTLIVLYDAWDLLENTFLAPRLESLLDTLQQNNAAVVFTTSRPLESIPTYIFPIIMEHCATRIILPDDIRRDYISAALGINEHEARRLLKMDRQKGDILLQQNHESIGLRLYLKDLDDIYAILSNDNKNLAAALADFK